MPASATLESRRTEERGEESEGKQNNAPIVTVTSPLTPIDRDKVPPEPVLPGGQPPSFSDETDSLADNTNDDPLPDYTRGPHGPTIASAHLPSYARATGHKPTIEELIPNEEQRLASLRAFAEEKKYANDYFGGHKGRPEGPPNDPLKVFRWAKKKMSGDGAGTWRRMSADERARWEEQGGQVDEMEGEVAEGDVDTHQIA